MRSDFRLATLCLVLGMASGIFGIGCQDPNYLYWSNHTQNEIISTHKLTSLANGGKVDILWVIDNSGSMELYQQAVIANADLFMNELMKYGNLDWKIGLLSTDDSQPPYLGFSGKPEVTYSTPQAADLFRAGVGSLGILGSGIEKMFSPVVLALTREPEFLRPGAYLALLTVTDAAEQSETPVSDFLNFLAQRKNGLNQVLSYAALAPDDFGCHTEDTPWNYAGSIYESYINATHGKVFKLCSPTFGADLASVGQDIFGRVVHPRILLSNRPKTESIRVRYRGAVLPAGLQSEGGYWLYDVELNAVVFHDLKFAPGSDEEVELTYVQDDGL